MANVFGCMSWLGAELNLFSKYLNAPAAFSKFTMACTNPSFIVLSCEMNTNTDILLQFNHFLQTENLHGLFKRWIEFQHLTIERQLDLLPPFEVKSEPTDLFTCYLCVQCSNVIQDAPFFKTNGLLCIRYTC